MLRGRQHFAYREDRPASRPPTEAIAGPNIGPISALPSSLEDAPWMLRRFPRHHPLRRAARTAHARVPPAGARSRRNHAGADPRGGHSRLSAGIPKPRSFTPGSCLCSTSSMSGASCDTESAAARNTGGSLGRRRPRLVGLRPRRLQTVGLAARPSPATTDVRVWEADFEGYLARNYGRAGGLLLKSPPRLRSTPPKTFVWVNERSGNAPVPSPGAPVPRCFKEETNDHTPSSIKSPAQQRAGISFPGNPRRGIR